MQTKKSNLKLRFSQLQAIINAVDIIRDYPQLSWEKANQINTLKFQIKDAFNKHKDTGELMDSRGVEIMKLKDTDNVAFTTAVKDHNEAIVKLERTQYDVGVILIPISIFSDLSIDGYKEVPNQGGQTIKFSYRDAYFSLLELGVIA